MNVQLLGLLLVLVAATRAARLPRIGGGTDVHPVGKWPWQGSVQFLKLIHACGCTVLSADWVLTFAYCTSEPSFTSVLLGAHDMKNKVEGNPTFHDVAEVILHPGYSEPDEDGKVLNDIALMRLTVPADLSSEFISAATLVPAGNNEPFADCFITGWGYSDMDESNADILQEARVSVISNEACEEVAAKVGSPGIIDESQLCVNGSGNAMCVGDFGGPVVCLSESRWLVVGVISYLKFDYCVPELPTVSTRVSMYREWITEATNGDILVA